MTISYIIQNWNSFQYSMLCEKKMPV